ncbi:putative protein-(glutamine-N5) methyltransferase, unknown substrate-specific [Saccharomonospora marina XMU15]|uniref:peptide chain release factor N(5)-glutamine methyltransferase n=1 Tax=Saccharomonospora marina XMU15 TaxID=882083 RepID=H5X4N1_9PSEU|nr:putative protein N(5)-glutamine methyltransferase [Saccharomonospora marina]EHR51107.1 putative protein-(glutamine-N5) methyltransferase, unknown substrate-specific [Saccharomonospora marina XMU15]
MSLPLDQATLVHTLRAAGCVFAEDEARLLGAATTDPAELGLLLDRRVSGVPLEHVLGWAEFCGLRVAVDPGVFVPRRRTEFLARQAATLARPGAVVVDLCCGCGAIGAAVLAAVPGIELHAADLEPAAVGCARRNLAGPGATVYEGDLDEPLPAGLRGRVDVLVANVPYVPSEAVATMPPEARDHEPRRALDGGADGLSMVRRLATVAPRWLGPTGQVLFEVARSQLPSARAALTGAGLVPAVRTCDEVGATVLVATRSR